MLQKETIDFLTNLAKNNNREWFNNNKSVYLVAKLDFENLVDNIIDKVKNFDPSVERLEAKDCVFRIYKDTRFSKDKTPYKTNMGASLVEKESKTLNNAGYYIHLEPGKSFVAGGIYRTETRNLNAIRTQISKDSQGFLRIIEKASFKAKLELKGDKLVRIPQGFDKTDPMEDYLKFKQFTVFSPISDEELLRDDIAEKISSIFEEIYPFNRFLNEAIAD